jgi:cysteine-rich secretory family protein
VVCLLVLRTGVAFAQGDIEQCFVDRTNAERAQRGLGVMAVNQDLVAMARRQSQRMADAGTIFHNQNLAADGPKGWKLLGENVGVGPSCGSLHEAFMNSEHHRDNILEPRFNYVGMGVVVSGGSTIYITEQFMQAGASPASSKAASPPPPAPSPKPSPSPKPAVAPSPKPTTPKPSPSPRPAQPSRAPSPSPAPSPTEVSPSPVPASASPPGSPSVRAAESPPPPGPSPLVIGGLGLLVVAGAGLAWALTRRRGRS